MKLSVAHRSNAFEERGQHDMIITQRAPDRTTPFRRCAKSSTSSSGREIERTRTASRDAHTRPPLRWARISVTDAGRIAACLGIGRTSLECGCPCRAGTVPCSCYLTTDYVLETTDNGTHPTGAALRDGW